MTPNFLWAGALSLVLIHDETSSCQSALNAALVLDKLCEMDLDDEPRTPCERASQRLGNETGKSHACPA